MDFLGYKRSKHPFCKSVPSRTTNVLSTLHPVGSSPLKHLWRGLWCPANLKAQRFRATGRSGYILSFLRKERLGEKGGAFLKGKEGRVGFRTLLLFHHVPEEQSITYDISAPHTLRLLDQAIEPFQTMLLPPHWRTLHSTSEEVKDSTDGTYMTMDVQLIPMRVRPLLLLRRRHANPEQTGLAALMASMIALLS